MRPCSITHAVLLLASFTLLPAAGVAAQSHHTGQHQFQDAAAWAKKFDDPKRDAWQKPDEVIQALQLRPDAVVADIGAGTGYFAVRFARAAARGRVFGVDTEPDMVKYLGERAKRERLNNLIAVAAEPSHPRVPEKTDLIILVNTYHHIDKRELYFRQLQQSLKSDGRLAIIDFRLDAPEGPPAGARVAPEQVKKEMRSAGYMLAQDHAFLPNQYFLVFRPEKPEKR